MLSVGLRLKLISSMLKKMGETDVARSSQASVLGQGPANVAGGKAKTLSAPSAVQPTCFKDASPGPRLKKVLEGLPGSYFLFLLAVM